MITTTYKIQEINLTIKDDTVRGDIYSVTVWASLLTLMGECNFTVYVCGLGYLYTCSVVPGARH